MLTKKNKEVLDFIISYALKNSILPTFDEIGAGVNLASKNSVYIHVHKLEKEGYIEFYGSKYKVKGIHYEYDKKVKE